MNAKALIPLVAGLGIGGFALKIGLDTLRSARGAQRPTEQVQIWAASDNIPRGVEITEEMLKPIAFPAGLLPPGALKDKEQIVGRMPELDLPGQLPILEHMLLPPGVRSRLHVKPGYRAVAVKIDEGSGVDYHLEPGCFVDVVGSFPVRREGRQETVATTIIENVEVAAVGPRVSPLSSKDGEGLTGDRKVRAVTLFVKPEDAPKLHITEQEGRIKLCLRGDSIDTQEPRRRTVVSRAELTGEAPPATEPPAAADGPPGGAWWERLASALGHGAAAAAPPPPALAAAAPPPPPVPSWNIDVYRGQSRETLRFKDAHSRETVDGGPAAPAPAGAAARATPGVAAGAGAGAAAGDGPSSTRGAETEPKELTE